MVRVYDGNGDKLIATVTPFPGFYGRPSVAMGEVEGNGVLDLVVGTGKGVTPESSSTPASGMAFRPSSRASTASPARAGGVSVAAAQIDGSTADNIIVGSGPGAPDRIKVFGTELPSTGTAPALFTISPFRGRPLGCERRCGVGRPDVGSLQHRHRAGSRQPGERQGLPLLADDADRGCSDRQRGGRIARARGRRR